eukprot:gene29364-12455_t
MPPAAYGYMGGAAYGGYHPAMMMRYGQYGGGYGGAAPPGPYGVPVYGAPTMGVATTASSTTATTLTASAAAATATATVVPSDMSCSTVRRELLYRQLQCHQT